MRPLLLLLLFAGCAVPEPATGPAPSQGQVSGDGGSQPTCSCYFETWSLRMPCGTRCLGDSKLSCTASSASVDPRGCAVPASDAGPAAATDAGFVDDTFDAGFDAGPTCTPRSSTCGCTIYPYGGEGFSLTVPCCATLCVASQTDHAWSCSATGQTELSAVPAVCRR